MSWAVPVQSGGFLCGRGEWRGLSFQASEAVGRAQPIPAGPEGGGAAAETGRQPQSWKQKGSNFSP